MKDQRTSYGAETTDCVLDVNRHTYEKNWTHTPSASGSYGRLADEMQVIC